jgi:hypothetical protein
LLVLFLIVVIHKKYLMISLIIVINDEHLRFCGHEMLLLKTLELRTSTLGMGKKVQPGVPFRGGFGDDTFLIRHRLHFELPHSLWQGPGRAASAFMSDVRFQEFSAPVPKDSSWPEFVFSPKQ